ncbi:MAG: hypothetical protein O6934_02715 [SAR324 cluster bacterium]|nr:hypothetical protein [SAR324 cluster bacterium]
MRFFLLQWHGSRRWFLRDKSLRPTVRSLRGLCRAGFLLFALMIAADLAGILDTNASHTYPYRRLGQNPRALALGNTGISYSNDEMALFYNPAGLGAVENSWVEILPIAVEGSDAGIELISDVAGGALGTTAELVAKYTDQEIHLRGFFYPHILINFSPGFTIGAAYFLETTQEITLFSITNADVFFREDKGTALGLAFPLFDGKVLFGLSTRSITRTAGEQENIDPSNAAFGGTIDIELMSGPTVGVAAETGEATGFDVGIIWRMESFPSLRGQFGLVVQNIGDVEFDGITGAGSKIPQEISLGWAFHPRLTPAIPMLIALEYRDLTQDINDDGRTPVRTSDGSAAKRTHFGIEIGFLPLDGSTNLITVRAGINGDSPSYGVEFSLWHAFTIQYVIFYEEFGKGAGQDSRKRQLLQFNLLGF